MYQTIQVESKYVEKSRQYTILEKDITKVRVDHKVITEFCDKKNGKVGSHYVNKQINKLEISDHLKT